MSYVDKGTVQTAPRALARGFRGKPEELANANASAQAAGAITFTGQPVATETITINGTAFTFVASGATGNQINIGASLSATLDNAVTVLNASVVAGVAKATYSKTGTTILTVIHDEGGTVGNAFTLAEAVALATVSGATLTGGTNRYLDDETSHHTFAVTGAIDKHFYLAAGLEGQKKSVSLASRASTGNVVLYGAFNAAGVSITFDTAGEFAVLEYLAGKWRVLVTTATVA